MKLILCAAFIWINVCCILHAEEITAEYKQGIYYLNASFIVEASPESVVAALTDYENISQLHPSIIESEILETTSSRISARIRTVVKDCAIFFCKKITRVENITQSGFESLDAEVVPFLSDLRSGHTSWKFVGVDNHTEVTYQATMQPKFWIPPLIRSHTVTKKFKKRISEIVQRLQMLAPSYSVQ